MRARWLRSRHARGEGYLAADIFLVHLCHLLCFLPLPLKAGHAFMCSSLSMNLEKLFNKCLFWALERICNGGKGGRKTTMSLALLHAIR